jgi:hypothetical protein
VNVTSTKKMVVGCAGTQVVAHAGLHALGRFADKIGLGAALSPAFPWPGECAPGHDRGKVLTHVMLMLTGGGESCADIEQLRIQDELFGDVRSDSTVHRTFHQITPTILSERVKIENKIKNIRKDAEAKAKGENHSRRSKGC